MEGQLCCSVGFLGGGSVTPSPTPTPTTEKATYRVLQWNGSSVKALCDVYGRLFTRYDSANDVYNGVAWTNEGLDKTFDSIDEHADAFLTLIHTYGHNDAVTGEGVDNVVINLDGTSTEFTFTDGQLVPVSSAWANGSTPTLFKRTLNDGTDDVVVVCDADGKLVLNTSGEGYFIYNNESDAISPRSNNQSALVTAAGGSVLADTFGDNDGNYYLISLDGYTVCANDDGVVTVGIVNELVSADIVWKNAPDSFTGPKIIATNHDGQVIIVNDKGTDLLIYKDNYDHVSFTPSSNAPQAVELWGIDEDVTDVNIPAPGTFGTFVYNGVKYYKHNYEISPVIQ